MWQIIFDFFLFQILELICGVRTCSLRIVTYSIRFDNLGNHNTHTQHTIWNKIEHIMDHHAHTHSVIQAFDEINRICCHFFFVYSHSCLSICRRTSSLAISINNITVVTPFGDCANVLFPPSYEIYNLFNKFSFYWYSLWINDIKAGNISTHDIEWKKYIQEGIS